MSLSSFHKVFIACAFLGCSLLALWASGHNAASLHQPALLAVSVAGMAALVSYFAWAWRHL